MCCQDQHLVQFYLLLKSSSRSAILAHIDFTTCCAKPSISSIMNFDTRLYARVCH